MLLLRACNKYQYLLAACLFILTRAYTTLMNQTQILQHLETYQVGKWAMTSSKLFQALGLVR